MSVYRVSERYARSLFELAQLHGHLSKVSKDMEAIERLWGDLRPFRRFLESPILRENKKVDVLRALFSERFHQLSMRFIELLTKKGRAPYLGAIASAFMARYWDHGGFISAELRVASPISDSLRQQFEQYVGKLTQKKPRLALSLREELLGGFVLRLGNQQIDKSVASQLASIRKSFMQASST